MKKPPRRPKLAITFGVLLLSGAGLLAWLWFYMLEPMRRFADLRWGSLHSELARWEKEQEHYLRTGVAPDRMSPPERLAFYGDKHWFEWLLGRLSGKGRWYEFEGCEACQFSCLEGMANHSFDSVDEWVRWYSANSGKTQEDWIQQGFEEKGFRIGLPPSKSDAVTLLGVLGTRSSDSEDVDSKGNQSFVAPYFLRYNAFRWLRDMGLIRLSFCWVVVNLSFPRRSPMDCDNSGISWPSFPLRIGWACWRLRLLRRPIGTIFRRACRNRIPNSPCSFVWRSSGFLR